MVMFIFLFLYYFEYVVRLLLIHSLFFTLKVLHFEN